MHFSPFLRICAAAVALSTLSFAAGVAGDLSNPPPVSGVSVVLRIPPELPADSPRAGPLPPLPRTATAQAQSRTALAIHASIESGPVIAPGPLLIMVADHELAHTGPAVVLALKGEPRKLA